MLSIKRILTENIGTKIVALILALLVWFYLNMQSTDKTSLTVPLKVEVPAQMLSRIENVDGDLINEVSIKLVFPKGERSDIPANLVCRHRVVNVNPELSYQILPPEDLSKKDFNLPAGISIAEIRPDKIRVILYKEGTKYLRIKTDNCLKGAPRDGYRVVSIKAEPSEILVKGPQHILDKYDGIAPLKVDLTNRDSKFTRPGQVEPLLDGERIEPVGRLGEFNIEVNIQEKLDEKVFPQVPIKLVMMEPDFPFQIQLKSKERGVKVRGPALSIKTLKAEHINLYIKIKDLYGDLSEIKPPMSFTPQVHFQLTPDAPKDIELAEPIEPINIDIVAPPAPEPPKPPEPPKEPPKVPEPPKPPEPEPPK